MQEVTSVSSLATIEFPRRTRLIKRLRAISFIINDITLFASFLVILLWLAELLSVSNFFSKLAVAPFTPVLFIVASLPLLFGAKRHLISTDQDAEKEDRPWWSIPIPVFLASITALLGLINIFPLTTTGLLTVFHISSYAGFCFFLIGIALIPPFTRIHHRFHITQGLVFVVSGISVFIVLENLYQLFSSSPTQHSTQVPLLAAMAFAFDCFGILLRWSNRGFFGNFTLDSTISRLALRLFLINLISGPLIAFLILYASQRSGFNMYQVITIIVTLFAITSSILLWINVKLLYRYELEHLLMSESLRFHNIDLTTEEESLRKRMAQLEQEKQRYLDKLDSENRWQEAAEALD